MPPATRRVKLAGGPDQSATFAEISGDGSLVVEFYDHSDEARNLMGSDVAYILTIRPGNKARLLRCLLGAAVVSLGSDDIDEFLLMLLGERFDSYFDLRDWLEANALPFHKMFDGRA